MTPSALPNHCAMSATPSSVTVCAGFVPAATVIVNWPSDRMSPVNAGGVPVSSTRREIEPPGGT